MARYTKYKYRGLKPLKAGGDNTEAIKQREELMPQKIGGKVGEILKREQVILKKNARDISAGEYLQMMVDYERLRTRTNTMLRHMREKNISSPWSGTIESRYNLGANEYIPELQADLTPGQLKKELSTLYKFNMWKYQGIEGATEYTDAFNKKYGNQEILTETELGEYWKIFNRIKQAHPGWDSDQWISATRMVVNGTVKLEDVIKHQYFDDFVGDVLNSSDEYSFEY